MIESIQPDNTRRVLGKSSIHMRGRRGVVMILAALIFTVVLGMTGLVVDLGVSYLRSSELQAAADAAAFAAATILPIQTSTSDGLTRKAQAEALVNEYVLKNSDGQDIVDSIEFGDTFTDNEDGQLYTSVRVSLSRNVSYLFAPIVGLDGTIVHRHAKVRIEAVVGDAKIAPLGISLERRNSTLAGESVAITFGVQDEEVINGNFGSLDLDGGGGGAIEFYDHYVNGYLSNIPLNDPAHLIESQTGVITGKASAAFEDRYDACTHYVSTGGCSVTQYVPSCPRVIVIVIHQRVTDSPPHEYKPLGYAPYILQKFENKSLFVAPLTLHVKVGSSVPLNDLNYDFGLYRNRLVE